MKIIKIFATALCIVTLGSCKDTKKENKEAKVVVEQDKYTIITDSTSVSFTAYKTSEKLPVGGKFTTVNIEPATGNTTAEVLNGLNFSIPVSSLFTNDATGTRDPKIKEFFFGVMDDTELISGELVMGDDNQCTATIKLNGISKAIPLTYEVANDIITLNGVMNLEDWNALDAVASLNKVCAVLHTGSDGISKTWNEVAVQASVHLKVN